MKKEARLDCKTLRIIIKKMPDMVFLIRMEDGEVEFINPSAEEQLGYMLEELQKISMDGIRIPMKPEETFAQHLEEVNSKKLMTDYALLRCKNGSEMPVEVRARRITVDGTDYNLASARDITDRVESGIMYRDVVEGMNELVTRVDPEGRIQFINHESEEVFGLTAKACIGRSSFDFVHPDDLQKTKEAFASWPRERLDHVIFENRLIDLQGKVHHILWHVHLHYDSEGAVRYLNSAGSDISERVKAEQELVAFNEHLEEQVMMRTRALQQNMAFIESYKSALDAKNIVSKSDKNGTITYANENFLGVTGYTLEEVIGQNHRIIRHPDTPNTVFQELWTTILAKKPWNGVIKNRRKDGSHYWVDIVILPILDAKGEIYEFIAVRHDVTELVEKREALEQVAYTDMLTGMGNRQKLLRDIAPESDTDIALINIDQFSKTNDFYGHDIGDRLINEVGQAIERRTAGKVYRVYRLHGDEFAILNTGGHNARFVAWVEQLMEELNAISVMVEGNEIAFDLTAGVSCDQKAKLLSTADIALKAAKRSQRSMMVYDESLSIADVYVENIQWAKKLKEAMRDDRITVYYQPLVDNRTGEWTKYEVLMRMIDENGKVISPFFFLGIARQSKQYLNLTRVVIEKAFRTFAPLQSVFSINITIDDILSQEIQTYLFEAIDRYKIGSRLILELVESEGIENFDEVIEFVNRAKAAGCRLAIDDFGTGYSNFEYLMRLRADFIKIDGSLIRNIVYDQNARAVVATIVDFAKKTGLKTVAEFVEDAEIQSIVVSLGIDYSQGFYFAKPLPAPREEEATVSDSFSNALE